jgi:hypothetical protein
MLGLTVRLTLVRCHFKYLYFNIPNFKNLESVVAVFEAGTFASLGRPWSHANAHALYPKHFRTGGVA